MARKTYTMTLRVTADPRIPIALVRREIKTRVNDLTQHDTLFWDRNRAMHELTEESVRVASVKGR